MPPAVGLPGHGSGWDRDVQDPDDDNDGIPTRLEHYPVNAIAVVDRQTRQRRWVRINDVDQDGLPNWLDRDADGDGKSDTAERGATFQQRLERRVKPILADKDADGIPDIFDLYDADGPLGDLDGDGLPNLVEEWFGTNKYYEDTDHDGVDDGTEILNGDTDDDGVLDIFDADDDGDGILTQNELKFDQDDDGIVNYLDTDSDGDGTPDGQDSFTDPCVGMKTYPDPTDPATWNPDCWDRDCDGIPDVRERQDAVYVGGDINFWDAIFGKDTGGTYVYPYLQDGPCGMEDWDCDGFPNWSDPVWTDGWCWRVPR